MLWWHQVNNIPANPLPAIDHIELLQMEEGLVFPNDGDNEVPHDPQPGPHLDTVIAGAKRLSKKRRNRRYKCPFGLNSFSRLENVNRHLSQENDCNMKSRRRKNLKPILEIDLDVHLDSDPDDDRQDPPYDLLKFTKMVNRFTNM